MCGRHTNCNTPAGAIFMNAEDADIGTLLDRIARGESDLFLHVVRRHELRLRSYLAAQIYHSADLDDLAQEVFITAYRDLGSFRRGEDFNAWLRGIARNRLLVYLRSQRRRAGASERFQKEVALLAEEDMEAAARADAGDSVERLLHCIARLPEKLRRIVRSGLHGEKPAALAVELNTTVPAIYQLHYRANQLLRVCVSRQSLS